MRKFGLVFLSVLLVASYSKVLAMAKRLPNGRPNFVFILVDDLGRTDIGVDGGSKGRVKTKKRKNKMSSNR